jgi:pre-60S factor REI1
MTTEAISPVATISVPKEVPTIRPTCISCRLIFQTHEEQKEHYKTEFHRFNLKRKIASLPPVTFEAFKQKMEGNSETSQHSCCRKF